MTAHCGTSSQLSQPLRALCSNRGDFVNYGTSVALHVLRFRLGHRLDGNAILDRNGRLPPGRRITRAILSQIICRA